MIETLTVIATEIMTTTETAVSDRIETQTGGHHIEMPRMKISCCLVGMNSHGTGSANLRKSHGPKEI